MSKKSTPEPEAEDDLDLVDEPTNNIEPAGVGHNSMAPEEIKHILEHLERLIDERTEITDAMKDAMIVAKSKGYDARTIREMLKLRALDVQTRREREELRDLYMVALGMVEE